MVWRKARTLPGDDTAARMWMFGIARRVLSTYRRTVRRHSALRDKLRAELAARPNRSANAQDSELHTVLGILDQLDQEIIRLTYWDGFTQKEAAQILGLPEGTVRSRHHRARIALRHAVGAAPDISMPR